MNEERKKLYTQVAKNRQANITLILENISNIHNAMAIARTCDSFGIQTIHIIPSKKFHDYSKTSLKKTSTGINKWIDFKEHASSRECVNYLKKENYSLYGTSVDNKSISLTKIIFPNKKIALVFGNEKKGISPYLIRQCEKSIHIPMNGFAKSLNISVSVAIVLYEYTKQNKKNNTLPINQQNKLISQFQDKSNKSKK